MKRYRIIILQVVPGAFFAIIWELLVRSKPQYDFFLGSPSGMLRELISLTYRGGLIRDISVTAAETGLGFLAGSGTGTLVGLGLWGSEKVYLMSRPYLIALGSVPVFALGPVLVFWFGTGILSKVIMGFLVTFVVAVAQAYAGAREADPNLLKLVTAFGGSRRQVFRYIIVPSATMWVLSGIRLNIGMALLGAFVGEFISSRAGLGHMILIAESLYNVNQIWVGCICLVTMAVVLHLLTLPVERWAKRWQ